VTAGLLTALGRFGKKSREEILREPIRIAESGFRATGLTETSANDRWDDFSKDAKKIMGCPLLHGPGLRPCVTGALIKQPDLAKVLQEISSRGINGFYRGWVAHKLIDGIHEGKGILTLDDLYNYKPVFREPLTAKFKVMTKDRPEYEAEVVTMPPPSSGGALLIQMMSYMERARKQGLLVDGFGSVSSIHAAAFAEALAFADRAKFYGDPDQVHIPLNRLLSQDYLDDRWSGFDPLHAVIPQGAGVVPEHEGTETTHFSVIDSQGNAVAITTTLNDEYGSGFVPRGTGVFMNNEMDDFSIQPGVPNLFGLVGGEANAIAPGKRPLSSMSPTIVRDRNGFVHIVIGGAGGPRIPTAVFNTLMNRLVYGMSLPEAVAAPRIHEQWKPHLLYLDRFGFSRETWNKLEAMGYDVEESSGMGKLHALERFGNGREWGAADPRGEGVAVAE
jgi:gamma-glutamyltranspeptidase/glutathione hydrolase